MQLIANNLPIFSELTITLKKVWRDEMENDCTFDPWDWLHIECDHGRDLKPIEKFQEFYQKKISVVKTKFDKFVKYVETEIVDKSLRTLNIDKKQIYQYIKSINDLINQKLRTVMTKILDDYIKFIDFFAKKFEPKKERNHDDKNEDDDENIEENNGID